MDIFDKLALMGRRYEPRLSARTGERRFSLAELLPLFDRNSILELTTFANGREGKTVTPDPERKLKVSLLDDGLSAIPAEQGGWYEIYQTAPSGDLSRVRIVSYSANGSEAGEVRMLIGERRRDHYFQNDPLFDVIGSEARRR